MNQQLQRPDENQVMQDIAQDPAQLFGRVSHDEFCEAVNEKLQVQREEADDDLFSIAISDLDISKPLSHSK
ncbi:hypothetical protein MKW98_002821 [Papaver atlanticum]|uniref:Uncharacterized protein n=1 Tax=Papaver atlanticum TaxID=357466 RepID=A0AAD4X9D5_9MAGN|nr:hypothetical protein MKW98_002821 [Papaver atlanticum]